MTMRLLLDTHALLWWWTDDPQLSARARDAISDPANAASSCRHAHRLPTAINAWYGKRSDCISG